MSAISVEKMGPILARFALLFPHSAPTGARTEVTEVYAGLLRDFEASAVEAAARPLALRLKRFPFPADFVEQITLQQEA